MAGKIHTNLIMSKLDSSHKSIRIAAVRYISKHYPWIIATLVSVVAVIVTIAVVPWGVELAQKAEIEKEAATLRETATYYFTPTAEVEMLSVRDNAKCWGSLASSRPDAYRCIVDHEILDPCFYQSTVKYVDCPRSPTVHQILTVAALETNKIDVAKEPNTGQPWYIVLTNGAACNYYTGATDTIANGRIDYGCNDGEYLSLPLNSSRDIQEIKCYKPDKERIENCKIKEAWY